LRTYHTGTTGEYPDEERTSLKHEIHGLLENAGTEDAVRGSEFMTARGKGTLARFAT